MLKKTRRTHAGTDAGRTAPEWNRFDICEAWYLFASDWHEGQGSDGYAAFGRLDRLGFRPSPMLSTPRVATRESGLNAATEEMRNRCEQI
jgi:hypothetical protein